MDKLEKILDLIDHSEHYSEEQIRQLLADEECRHLYETLVEVDAAMAPGQPEPDLDAEWTALQRRVARRPVRLRWQKIAASFVGVLIVSGIALAAIRLARRPPSATPPPAATVQAAPQPIDTVIRDTTTTQAPKAPVHRVFENVTLEKMLGEMADYYGLKVAFRREAARQLRFYYEWDSQKGLQRTVDDLNQFENINITVEARQIIVE